MEQRGVAAHLRPHELKEGLSLTVTRDPLASLSAASLPLHPRGCGTLDLLNADVAPALVLFGSTLEKVSS